MWRRAVRMVQGGVWSETGLCAVTFDLRDSCSLDHVKSNGRKHLRIEMDRRGKAHGSGLRRRHRFAGQHMGWNKAIDGKGPDRSSKGGSCHQPRQDKGHENRKMAGDRQDCDRRGADRGGGGLLLLGERDVIKQQLRQGNQNTDGQGKCCIRNFGRLEKIWKSNGCSVDTKVRRYESIVLSTLLYGA